MLYSTIISENTRMDLFDTSIQKVIKLTDIVVQHRTPNKKQGNKKGKLTLVGKYSIWEPLYCSWCSAHLFPEKETQPGSLFLITIRFLVLYRGPRRQAVRVLLREYATALSRKALDIPTHQNFPGALQ